MINGRLSPALLSIGLAGGTLFGFGLFGLNMQTDHRTDIVQASGKSFVGPADDAFFVDLGAAFDGTSL